MNSLAQVYKAEVTIVVGCKNDRWWAEFCRVRGYGNTVDDAVKDMWEIIERRFEGYSFHE